MPRPRWNRLDPQRQDAILDAAAAEFGEHGYAHASYNRIIERAGLSKGAMYYYFDDKEDLYVTVMKLVADRVASALGPVPEVADAEAYWLTVQGIYREVLRSVFADERVAALVPVLLGLPSSSDAPAPIAELGRRARTWCRGLLERGRVVGAVRTDLPDDLIVDVTFAVGEAMDRWIARRLIAARAARAEAFSVDEALLDELVDMLRRLVAPGLAARPAGAV